MDGGAWWATVHGVAKSRTWLSHFTFTFIPNTVCLIPLPSPPLCPHVHSSCLPLYPCPVNRFIRTIYCMALRSEACHMVSASQSGRPSCWRSSWEGLLGSRVKAAGGDRAKWAASHDSLPKTKSYASWDLQGNGGYKPTPYPTLSENNVMQIPTGFPQR